jgi:hypothetical protein
VRHFLDDRTFHVEVPPDVHLPPGQHRVVIEVEDAPGESYDPAKVAAAFRAARGAFTGIDTRQLLADIHT